MGLLRKAILAWSPDLAAAIERESRQWIMQCPQGHEQSVWDAGGIRYRAAGNPQRVAWCPKCKRLAWHRIYWQADREDLAACPAKPPKPGQPVHGLRSFLAIVLSVIALIGVIFLGGVALSYLATALWPPELAVIGVLQSTFGGIGVVAAILGLAGTLLLRWSWPLRTVD